MKHLKNHELIKKVTQGNHNLQSLLDLYTSEKYSPFSFKKRIIYFLLIVGIALFLFGTISGNIIFSISGGILSFYCFNYVGQIKGYSEGTIEGLKDGFEGGKTTAWLELFGSLLKYKERGNLESEKSVIFLIMLYLGNKFEPYSNVYMDSHNKNLLEFRLKEIISTFGFKTPFAFKPIVTIVSSVHKTLYKSIGLTEKLHMQCMT
ncbi:hypothetical protein KBC86_03965, partial [Candidatus Gracilibacteria bacterium]|nr:hypothetical protein [Candidatus Gracilibacteria bacterium]